MRVERKESTGLYKSIVEHIQDMVMLTRPDGTIFYVSPSSEELLGYAAEELVDTKPALVHPDDRERIEAAQVAATAGEGGSDLEYRIVTKSGETRWVAHSWWPIEEEGQMRLFVNVVRDITARKAAETDLENSELRYRSLVESSFDGYFLLEVPSTKIIFINEGLRQVFGYDEEEVRRLTLWDVIDPREHDKIRVRMALRLEGKLPDGDRLTYRALHKDGTIRQVEVSNSLVTYHGKPAIQGVVRDLSESVRLQRQLLQSQKMEAIGKLAGGIAHDFNNLLMGIQGTASLLMRELGPGHAQRKLAENIDRYANNGASLTRQLLGFASGDGYEKRPMDVAGLLQSSAQMFGRTKKEISVEVRCEEGLCPISANRGQIEQALLNLYLNAWQAMPDGGKLEIHAQNVELAPFVAKLEAGRYVQIAISDSGVGMELDVLDRIFDPFFTTKEPGRGTGLGLASVYTIVQGHGGSIDVESSPGAGATFTILLPSSVTQPAALDEELEELSKGRERILLVDDEVVSLTTCRKMLEHLGYDVAVARSGQEALEIFEREQADFDLVLLDMVMPGMGGGDTLDKLREQAPELRVVLCSGYSEGEAADVLARGCNGFLQKPFSLETLSAKVKGVLEHD